VEGVAAAEADRLLAVARQELPGQGRSWSFLGPLLGLDRSRIALTALGTAPDRVEEEADRLANRVLAQPPARSPRPVGTVAGRASSPRSGVPLDPTTRTDMEARFSHDFSQVRVHNDWAADVAARSVNALAFTIGQDIVFRSGQYAPATPTGRRLLAHELAHVLHQRNAPTGPLLQRDPSPPPATTTTPSPGGGDAWPFGLPGLIALSDSYLDTRTTTIAVKLALNASFFGMQDGTEVELPASEFELASYNIVPILPVVGSLAEAQALEQPRREELRRRGLEPCAFYRAGNGVVVPTLLNPQTLPRTWVTYQRALEAERAGVRATVEALQHVALWYVGARFPVRTGRPAAPAAAAVEEGAVVGPLGSVTRQALREAASAPGPTVRVVTRLTRAPEAGRALSVATGEGAEALAAQARQTGRVFTADLPMKLLVALERVGLVERKITMMGQVIGTEYQFLPQATEFVLPFFHPL
jgi:Domain of unknown function (DUF4157)